MLQPVAELEKCLGRLPGFGRRSAQRAALALVREPGRLLTPLKEALEQARSEIVCCSRCGAFTVRSENPCEYCVSALRSSKTICVVEDPADIVTMESSGAFGGRYHALGGKLSPSKRMPPERLRLAELKSRVGEEEVEEVLLALSTDMDGDATAGYITEMLKGCGVKVTRLAFGLPADSAVAYSDPLTLRRAIAGRREM